MAGNKKLWLVLLDQRFYTVIIFRGIAANMRHKNFYLLALKEKILGVNAANV